MADVTPPAVPVAPGVQAPAEQAQPSSSAAAHPELAGDPEDVSGLKAGATHGKESWGTVLVKNGDGKARSHITIQARWNVPPDVPFSIFTYPNNSKLFRDVAEVGTRKVVSMQPGLKVVEVEQLQKVQILWMNRTFTTWLLVTEDSRNQDHLIVIFELMRSDVLSVFKGRWDIKSVKDESGKVVGCDAELNQDVLPRGIPKITQHVPLLGELLRSVSYRAIKRVMEDMNAAIEKIRKGMDAGRDAHQMLRELCGVFEEQGHANGAVASHAVAFPDMLEESEEEESTASPSKATNGQASPSPAKAQDSAPTVGSSPPAASSAQASSPAPAPATAAAGSAKEGTSDGPAAAGTAAQPAAAVPATEDASAAAAALSGLTVDGGEQSKAAAGKI